MAHLGSTPTVVGSSTVGSAACLLLQGFGQATFDVLGAEILVVPVPITITNATASGAPGVAGEGEVAYPLPIPDDPVLVGLEVDLQLVALDPGSPGGVIAASQGLTTLLHP